jgi:oxygen-independent coproporphyrinogen-3 oxidase
MALPQIWGRKIYTVFFGGGTPSLLRGESITEILRNVRIVALTGMHVSKAARHNC